MDHSQLTGEAANGYLLVDDEQCILDANERAHELVRPREVSVGTAVTALFPEMEATTGETPQRFEVGDRTVALRREPLLGEGRTLLVLSAATEDADLTYTKLLELLPTLSAAVDERRQFVFLDQAFETRFGCPVTELEGQRLESTVHPEDREAVTDQFEQLVAESGESRRFDCRVETPEGWRTLDVIGKNLLDQPPVGAVVLTARDITDRSRRKNILEQQNKRLEEFAEVVSHDIRSPLQVAKLHLQQVTTDDNEEIIEKIEASHDRIEAIVEDVLTLARHGQIIGERAPTSLEAVARDAWETVDSRQMELDIVSDREVPSDPDRLRQLLENLFRNAADHAGPDATVTVGPIDPMPTSTRAENLPKGFYVADDGPGIPDEQKDQVLDPGFTTAESGTGFGLAIVEQIAQAHQWEADVTDSRDGGARFEFTDTTGNSQTAPDR